MQTHIPNSKNWLDALMAKKRHKYLADTARMLHVTRATVQNWKKGRDEMSPYAAWMTAQALEINPITVLSCTEYHKAKTELQKEMWESIYIESNPTQQRLI